MPTPFPFSAIVGQDEMKQAILVAAVDPGVGGVLEFGDRGTGKSTAVRALAALLPPMRVTLSGNAAGFFAGCVDRACPHSSRDQSIDMIRLTEAESPVTATRGAPR